MKNQQEFWTAMIISGYSKRLGITLSEAANRLLASNSINYLEEYYKTLHLLSNEDVISELINMTDPKAVK